MNLKLLIASLVPLLLSTGSVFADDLPEIRIVTSGMEVIEMYAADQAALRQEEPVLIVDAFDEEHAEAVSRELSELRSSGKLADLILSMGVRYDKSHKCNVIGLRQRVSYEVVANKVWVFAGPERV